MMDAPVSDALVFFGVTGDLAFKKIFPALQASVRCRGVRGGPFGGVASARWTLDAVEAAWHVVDPVPGNATPVHEYEPNTWGPAEADALIAADGGWDNLAPPETGR